MKSILGALPINGWLEEAKIGPLNSSITVKEVA